MRILETPSIKPLYLNVSKSMKDSRVTVYGGFKCPDDTTAEIDDGTIVKFDKVLNSGGSSTDFELVLNYDMRRYLARLTLSSKSASEFLHIYLRGLVDDSVQTDFTGTNCSVGINRSSESQTTTYTSAIQNYNNGVDDKFTIGLNKSGKIIRLDSNIYCYSLNAEYRKYFKSRCSMYESEDPLYVTFYEEKMATDNVELLYLNYMFNPLGHCSQICITNMKRWFFSII
ncbi:uncharacterized protein LOC133197944 [Saccostrea echinata]|uniref:uncharacterized protein LOC133197944 n=1 Tax=Saccostrea echinata TaxID=191078 RepID=UPI002A7FDB2E|nr:uncharacterized protein LOC133197944 [Saccostrea echinata]